MSTSAPETTQIADAPTTSTEPAAGGQGPQEPTTFDREYVQSLRQEAARFRAERNQTRDELHSLRQRVEAHDRRHVEQLAAERLQDPRDLLDRASLDELRGEDGSISEQAVSEAVDALLADRPHLGKPPSRVNWGQGARGTRAGAEPSFGEALKNRHQR